jgi:23S rRNA (guanosine2251-2'-O)-methyltransferase
MAKQPLLGSHQRSWIWGRNLLLETLRAGRWLPHEIRLASDSGGLEEIATLAEMQAIEVRSESNARLTQLCGATDHQGVIARMPPFPYADGRGLVDDALRSAIDPILLITDHLQDAFNFGAILRSAECFGVAGILIPTERQVGVTSQVARSSAGAASAVPIARVANLLQTAEELRVRGVRLVAANEHAASSLTAADLAGPLAIVIGNEGRGIDPALLDRCDLAVSIPLAGQIGSLNAAVAAGIVLYEAVRQRRG